MFQWDRTFECTKDIQRKRAATSTRQAAEWGMQAFQSSFPWVKDWFVYKEQGERCLIMKMIVLSYNLRANIVGINQIQNFYMPNLEQCGNALIHDELF